MVYATKTLVLKVAGFMKSLEGVPLPHSIGCEARQVRAMLMVVGELVQEKEREDELRITRL